jgi:hypothetical protein
MPLIEPNPHLDGTQIFTLLSDVWTFDGNVVNASPPILQIRYTPDFWSVAAEGQTNLVNTYTKQCHSVTVTDTKGVDSINRSYPGVYHTYTLLNFVD